MINNEFFKLFDVQLEDGRIEESNDDYSYIYLGYDLKDLYSVGDIIVKGNKKYMIAGVIKKNTYITNEGMFCRNSEPADPVVNIDTKVLVDSKSTIFYQLYIAVEDDRNFDKVFDEIMDVCKNYKVNVTYDNLNDVYVHNASYYDDTVNALTRLLCIILVVTFIMQLCIQYVITKKNSYTYTVLTCNGFSTKDVVCINVIDSAFKIIFSLLITFILTMCWMNYERESVIAREVGKDLILSECLSKCLILLLIIMIIINIYTYMLIKLNTKNELLGANRK